MNARQFQDRFQSLLLGLDCEAFSENELVEIEDVTTFDMSGLLTRDKGLVIQFANGDEFQITIKQSEVGNDGEGDD